MAKEKVEDAKLFDCTETKVEYSRTRDTKRVTATIRDPAGISELKLYLILCIEVEKLERRLGIFDTDEKVH